MNSDTPTPFSLYLHIPFCKHRCCYCDFNTYAGIDHWIPEYVAALIREIELVAASREGRLAVHSIFFGGGTPSLIGLDQYAQIFAAVRGSFDLSADCEITLEANPGTVNQAYLAGLRAVGFNRISFGMQSASPEMLRMLERQHSLLDICDAVHWARQAGFQQINLDLIYGLPEQTLNQWKHTLAMALELHPEHLSCYSLTVEPGTPLFHWVERGLVSPPDNDLAADMYEWTEASLVQAGFAQYEISNWARADTGTDLRCRHNLQYWRNLPYLGFGAGAHGYADGMRTANENSVPKYIRSIQESGQAAVGAAFPASPSNASRILIDHFVEMQETMMVGLRLVDEGVSRKRFMERFQEDMGAVFRKQIRFLVMRGLLEWALPWGDALRLTPEGHLLGNRVFREFVGEG
jgi:oxygen-independent coproporphyrinogen-3 oxidase